MDERNFPALPHRPRLFKNSILKKAGDSRRKVQKKVSWGDLEKPIASHEKTKAFQFWEEQRVLEKMEKPTLQQLYDQAFPPVLSPHNPKTPSWVVKPAPKTTGAKLVREPEPYTTAFPSLSRVLCS